MRMPSRYMKPQFNHNMQKRFFLLIATILTCVAAWAQTGTVTTSPSPLNADKQGKITFIDTNGIFTGINDLYVHIGVLDAEDVWHNTPDGWCDNNPKYLMTKESDKSWSITLGPTVREYFGATIEIKKIGLVVRNVDGSKQTKPDMYITCEDGALYTTIEGLPTSGIVDLGFSLPITAKATKDADITLTIKNGDNEQTFTGKGTSLTQSYTFANEGDYTITATSVAGEETHTVSSHVAVCGQVVVETRPAGTIEGINIIDENTVTFVLFDKDKKGNYSQRVFWVGDNSDWDIKNTFMMKRDNTNHCWWITIDGFEPKKEYAFQYHVIPNGGGEGIRFADPYSTKILDPWNDKYIGEDIYPGLREFPDKAWNEPATAFTTTGSEYQWEVENFTVKSRDNLVIYELLLRDFTAEKTLKAAMEKLPYLQSLGVNAIELMPVQEFDGNLSWGYNPCYFFALDKAYGTDEDYRIFIDECHKLGIAVFFDVVYNHATGKFPYCKLWWDSKNNKTTANNPWFNVDAPHPFSVFHDFNHTVPEVKAFIKRNLQYLLTEYKIDGFRFDLTKGFTNKPSNESTSSQYDQTRIDILKEYNAAIKAVRPDACMILEHLCDQSEEKVLGQDGMLCWRNMNHAYCQSAMGWKSESAVDGVYANGNNMPKNSLVGYMESHDEERTAYKAVTYGVTAVKNSLATRIDQAIATAAQFLTIPGPKMIWQFGELGYDISIEYNDRTGEKPVKWEYADDAERHRLWVAYAKMNTLRNYHAELFAPNATFTYKLGGGDWENGRYITLTSMDGSKSVVVAINLSENSGNYTLNFPKTGLWRSLLTDETLDITSSSYNKNLPAHSCVIYTNFEVTAVEDAIVDKVEYTVYPNPASDVVYINAQGDITVYNLAGSLVKQATGNSVNVSDLPAGMYMINVTNEGQSHCMKFMKN